jgi:hypothetical protein
MAPGCDVNFSTSIVKHFPQEMQQENCVSCHSRWERRKAKMANTKQTSPKVASQAGRLLSNPKTPKPIRSVAASDLAQTRTGKK